MGVYCGAINAESNAYAGLKIPSRAVLARLLAIAFESTNWSAHGSRWPYISGISGSRLRAYFLTRQNSQDIGILFLFLVTPAVRVAVSMMRCGG